MTFNVRRPVREPNRRAVDRWEYRQHAIRALLEAERPAILGAQEVLYPQALWIAGSLGDDYRRVGRGRNADGGGEGCPIFIDTSRLRIASWAQLALSDTPLVPGSRSWGNVIPRMAVTAELVDRATNAHFRVINVHFDHLSRRSRLWSAAMIADLVALDPLPVIVMGDVNTSVGTRPYERILSQGMSDAWLVADQRVSPRWGTFPNYRDPNLGGKRIDWILVSPGVHVELAGMNAARIDGVAPSDHLPFQTVVRVDAA
jgi:endonuclease/exonuclease/phosphatase family metal-dependent hydrolase